MYLGLAEGISVHYEMRNMQFFANNIPASAPVSRGALALVPVAGAHTAVTDPSITVYNTSFQDNAAWNSNSGSQPACDLFALDLATLTLRETTCRGTFYGAPAMALSAHIALVVEHSVGGAFCLLVGAGRRGE